MKRKLFCIAVAIVMILPLAFAAIPTAFAETSVPDTVSVSAEHTPSFCGAQYRTAGSPGLRFCINVSMYNDVNNANTIERMGTLIIPTDKLTGDAKLAFTENGKIGDTSYLDIPARFWYDTDGTSFMKFTAVLMDIPDDSRRFTAVAYIIYKNGTVVYSAPFVRSIDDVKLSAGVSVEGVVNVKDHGAKGDGSSDDTAAIKAAIAAASGKIVYFPAGTYKVSSLTFPENVIPYFAKNAFVNHSSVITVNSKEIYSSGTAVFIGNGGFAGFASIGVVNAKWFGAYGDGIHDDTAAIQNAVNYGSSIYVPEGTYLINSSVRLDQKKISNVNTFITGDGMKKSVFKIADNVKGFYGEATSAVASVSFDNLGLVGNNRTAYGIYFTKVSRVDMTNCYIAGLKWGCYYTYSGNCRFSYNLAENNDIVYNIGEYSMFLYYEYLTNRNNGVFLYCDVPESGGVSNGILISHCTSENNEREDVYVTRNQTVFIEDCTFTGGKGGRASVYYYSSCDMRVVDSVISSSAANRAGIYFDQVIDGYVEGNTVTVAEYAFKFSTPDRSGTYVKNNVLCGGAADVAFGNANDVKIFRNVLNGTKPAASINSSQKQNILFCQNTIAVNKCDIVAAANIVSGVVGNNNFADGNL